jgi:hypothetical protein
LKGKRIGWEKITNIATQIKTQYNQKDINIEASCKFYAWFYREAPRVWVVMDTFREGVRK